MYFAVGVGNLGAVGQNLRGPLDTRLIRNNVTSGGICSHAEAFAECKPFPTNIFFGDVIDRLVIE